LSRIDIRAALGDGWRDFTLAWPRLLATDLLYKLLAFAILAPLSSLALNVFLATSGNDVLADQDILLFVLSPVGIVALIVLSALTVAILALEQACFMTIAYGGANGVRVPVVGAFLQALKQAGDILLVALRAVVTVLVIATPFVAVAAFIGLRLLTEFDINFYLSQRPREFWLAAWLIGSLAAVMLTLMLPRLAGWAYALPTLLFEGASPRAALAQSQARVTGNRWRVGAVLLGWAFSTTFSSLLVLGAVGWIGRLMVARVGTGVAMLVLTVGFLFVLWSLANLLLTFFQVSGFAVLIVGLYTQLGVEADAALLKRLGSAPNLETIRWRPSATALWGGVVVAALVAGGAGLFLLREVRVDDDVQVIAHRGASLDAPENTMAAVLAALDQGSDQVEIDVQETADGQVVVAHDADLMKVAGNPLRISDATMETLAPIDIGSWFAPEYAGERVPALAEVLEASRGRAVVNIELKYYGREERLEQRTVDVVEAHGMADEVVVMSLKRAAVATVRSLRSNWRVGLLSAAAVGDLTRVDADFLAVNTAVATRAFVRRAHARGKDVYVWTVNDPVAMWQLINLGVDGLITDDPALAREVLEYREGLSSAERLLISAAIVLGEQPTPSRQEEA
jgi:glycerophosphoryl diester phosphodiesterase